MTCPRPARRYCHRTLSKSQPHTQSTYLLDTASTTTTLQTSTCQDHTPGSTPGPHQECSILQERACTTTMFPSPPQSKTPPHTQSTTPRLPWSSCLHHTRSTCPTPPQGCSSPLAPADRNPTTSSTDPRDKIPQGCCSSCPLGSATMSIPSSSYIHNTVCSSMQEPSCTHTLLATESTTQEDTSSILPSTPHTDPRYKYYTPTTRDTHTYPVDTSCMRETQSLTMCPPHMKCMRPLPTSSRYPPSTRSRWTSWQRD